MTQAVYVDPNDDSMMEVALLLYLLTHFLLFDLPRKASAPIATAKPRRSSSIVF